jgi:chromate reductase, NAD(P)H dehydrogenase (quinone)
MGRDVIVLVGSLRRESLTRKIANVLVKLAPATLNFAFIEIGNLQHYNADLEIQPPVEWVAFRDRVRRADAVLFVTPEYNRSVPGVLKNAIDVASRPSRQGAINGKPAAVVSVSPGAISGFGANHHLRQMLVFLDMPALQQPEAYVGGADKLLGPDGELTNDSTRLFLTKVMEAFAEWIERFSK